jgi:hypothetical protein
LHLDGLVVSSGVNQNTGASVRVLGSNGFVAAETFNLGGGEAVPPFGLLETILEVRRDPHQVGGGHCAGPIVAPLLGCSESLAKGLFRVVCLSELRFDESLEN